MDDPAIEFHDLPNITRSRESKDGDVRLTVAGFVFVDEVSFVVESKHFAHGIHRVFRLVLKDAGVVRSAQELRAHALDCILVDGLPRCGEIEKFNRLATRVCDQSQSNLVFLQMRFGQDGVKAAGKLIEVLLEIVICRPKRNSTNNWRWWHRHTGRLWRSFNGCWRCELLGIAAETGKESRRTCRRLGHWDFLRRWRPSHRAHGRSCTAHRVPRGVLVLRTIARGVNSTVNRQGCDPAIFEFGSRADAVRLMNAAHVKRNFRPGEQHSAAHQGPGLRSFTLKDRARAYEHIAL